MAKVEKKKATIFKKISFFFKQNDSSNLNLKRSNQLRK